MDGDQRTSEAQLVAHFGQSGIRALLNNRDHAGPVSIGNFRLPPDPVIERAYFTGRFTLLDKLFHHAERDAKSLRDNLSRVFLFIVAGKYSLANIEG